MKKLPKQQTLKALINEMLLNMQIGQTSEYYTTDCNFKAFYRTYLMCKKDLVDQGKWLNTYNEKHLIFTIVRIK